MRGRQRNVETVWGRFLILKHHQNQSGGCNPPLLLSDTIIATKQRNERERERQNFAKDSKRVPHHIQCALLINKPIKQSPVKTDSWIEELSVRGSTWPSAPGPKWTSPEKGSLGCKYVLSDHDSRLTPIYQVVFSFRSTHGNRVPIAFFLYVW